MLTCPVCKKTPQHLAVDGLAVGVGPEDYSIAVGESPPELAALDDLLEIADSPPESPGGWDADLQGPRPVNPPSPPPELPSSRRRPLPPRASGPPPAP